MACNAATFNPNLATKPYSILNNPKVDFMQTSEQVLDRLQVPSQWSATWDGVTQRPYVTRAFAAAANTNSGTAFCRQQDVGKVALALGSSSAPTSLSSDAWVTKASPN